MCFSDKGFLEIYSVFHKKCLFSSMPIMYKKNYYDRYYDMLHTLAPIERQMLIYKVNFYCFQCILCHRLLELNLCLNSKCVFELNSNYALIKST